MAGRGRGDEERAGLESRYADYTVYDVHYEKIGKVDDLFVDEEDRPEYVGVKMGFLGTKSTLIPIELVRINDRRQLVEVAAEKEAVKGGPTFGDDREITPEFERRVLGYYRVETARVPADYEETRGYGTYYPGFTEERVDLRPGERAAEPHERPGSPVREPGRAREGALGSAPGGAYGEPLVGASGTSGTTGRGEDGLTVERIEEELRAGTREREAGGVNVRKRVRTDRDRLAVPKKREEVRVERVPVEEGREGDAGGRGAGQPEIRDDEIRVPVIEEEIVVEKRPVVREEIRLRKEVVEEEEVVEADLRKEEVEIDDQTRYRDG